MSCAVRVPGMNAIYFLTEPPDDREDFEVEEGAWIEIPMNHGLWHPDYPCPVEVLVQSRENRKHYKVYKYPDQIDERFWEDTGLHFGGTFSKESWARYVAYFPAVRALQAITEDESV